MGGGRVDKYYFLCIVHLVKFGQIIILSNLVMVSNLVDITSCKILSLSSCQICSAHLFKFKLVISCSYKWSAHLVEFGYFIVSLLVSWSCWIWSVPVVVKFLLLVRVLVILFLLGSTPREHSSSWSPPSCRVSASRSVSVKEDSEITKLTPDRYKCRHCCGAG